MRDLKMNDKDIIRTALRQSSYDCNCREEDFISTHNIVTNSKKNDGIGDGIKK